MKHPRFSSAHVISVIALFISIGGTAFAAATIDSGDVVNESLKSKDLKDGKAVRSTDIVDGEIGAADIADESVNGAKITDGSVATGDLANNAVTSAKIADATVAVGDLGTDSVISTKVLNDTLTGDDITESTLGAVPLATNLANVTVKRVEFTVANGADNGAIAVCPAGQQAISGGVRNDNLDTDGYVEVSRPSLGTGEGPTDGESFDGWRAFVFNQTDAQSGQTFGGNTLQATVWAVCAG